MDNTNTLPTSSSLSSPDSETQTPITTPSQSSSASWENTPPWSNPFFRRKRFIWIWSGLITLIALGVSVYFGWTSYVTFDQFKLTQNFPFWGRHTFVGTSMTIAFDISGLYASREYLQNSLISNGTGITEDRFQLSQNGPGVFVFDFSSSWFSTGAIITLSHDLYNQSVRSIRENDPSTSIGYLSHDYILSFNPSEALALDTLSVEPNTTIKPEYRLSFSDLFRLKDLSVFGYEFSKESCFDLSSIKKPVRLSYSVTDVFTGSALLAVRGTLPYHNYCVLGVYNGSYRVFEARDFHELTATASLARTEAFIPEDDFRSRIRIAFSNPIFTDSWAIDSPEYIAHRTAEKIKFLAGLMITPNIPLSIDQLVFTPTEAMLELRLEPEQSYSIHLKPIEDVYGLKLPDTDLSILTPSDKTLALRLTKKVTMFPLDQLPTFRLYAHFKSGDPEAKPEYALNLCKVTLEKYALFERLIRYANSSDTGSYITALKDKKGMLDCREKIVRVGTGAITPFDLSDSSGSMLTTGLYVISFKDPKDIAFDGRINTPILFSVVDSHITMKISKKGKAFFFVTDIATGKPIANQQITIMKNIGDLYKRTWNEASGSYDVAYYPLSHKVFDDPIVLGNTDKDGVLSVDIDNKLKASSYGLSFEEWWWEENTGRYQSFIATATDPKTGHLSYIVSTWNEGIAGWNFGFDREYGYNFYSDTYRESPEGFVGHMYADRTLYLPWEEVNLKAIFRKNDDRLSMPSSTQNFTLRVYDPTGKAVLEKVSRPNDFGSIVESYVTTQNAPIGNYSVSLSFVSNGQEQAFLFSSFNVQIFKNPTFENTVTLTASGLDAGMIRVTETGSVSDYGRNSIQYKGSFSIDGTMTSRFYNGASLDNAKFTYRVYRQPYYDWSYWDNCYYGCYWEPEKTFITEGEGMLEKGRSSFHIDADFASQYDDYKYIVEVTVTDASTGEEITGANSLIVRLPSVYKYWNPQNTITIASSSKFVKSNTEFPLLVTLNNGKWTSNANSLYTYHLYWRKYTSTKITDISGYDRPIMSHHDIEVASGAISLDKGWTASGNILSLPIRLAVPWEYSMTYSRSGSDSSFDSSNVIFVYGDDAASNPVIDDNKVRVLSEKVSYHIGEKARFLVRLPFSNGRVLVTVEKGSVLKREYRDVTGNMFFYELPIEESFAPNVYIGVVAIEPSSGKKVPEYRVGYAEVVVDKTDKKAFVSVVADKKEYKPREKVVLNLASKDLRWNPLKSELSVMVIDDSLIALMGNVDTDLLPKFYQKVLFQITTSLSNLGMLHNYYFSRRGEVWGGGGWDKGGDSSVMTRTVFKNTAYYSGSVVTDSSGKATVSFALPDNITNYRVIVVANTLRSYFGTTELTIPVRKKVLIEDRTPTIVHANDILSLGWNIFNTTDTPLSLTVRFSSTGFVLDEKATKTIKIPAHDRTFVSFLVHVPNNLSRGDLLFTLEAQGSNTDLSDRLQKSIELVEAPILWSRVKEVLALVESGALTLRVPANTDIERSAIKVTLSNTLLSGIESIISSLAEYPHGCIEQSTSTTFPNAILLRFSRVFQSVVKDPSVIQKNLSAGIERIRGMQQPDGGFAYWPGEVGSNLHITPYVLRTLILMKQSGVDVPDVMIGSAKQYLENSLDMLTDDTERAEAYWSLALAKSKKANVLKDKIDVAKLRTHGKVAYLYGLFLSENITNKTMLAALLNPKSVSQNDDYYYWTADSDRAILGSLLIDIKAPREKIDAIVGALYKKDYMSYWYSTQEKNNAFYLFSKYIEVYGSENVSSVTFDGLGRSETIALGASDPNYVTITFTGLADKVNHGEFPFSFSQTGTSPVYVTIEGSFYPKDLKQIPSQDTMGVSIKRIIYAVDEDMGGIVSGEIKLKPHTTDTFKHNALYKVRLEIAVDQNVSQNRQNFAIEDYLPASFRVINNAFLTNASIYDENTKKEWWWGYQQILKDMVFLSNQYDIPAFYEYFFRPEIKGTFIYPPATGYFMYSPSVEGHTGYRVIRVE